jgi:hypothetical protein
MKSNALMIDREWLVRKGFWLVALSFIISFYFFGCKDKGTEPDAISSVTATDDAAQTIASAVASENGGALDQVSDVMAMASPQGMGALQTVNYGISNVKDSTYDPATGWWTVRIERSKIGMLGIYSASFKRVYKIKFLNSIGNFQKYYIVPNGTTRDTAYSVQFKIDSGSGSQVFPHFSHYLMGLSGEWLITGVNGDTVTVNTNNNGDYTRTGVDTLTTTMRGTDIVRTSSHTLKLTFTNIRGPRSGRMQLADKTSGTITGTITSTITFLKGELYKERTITKTFTITFNNGLATITIDGKQFTGDPRWGIIK